MTFLQMLVISIVQGITEFLPISSSGHLILIPALTGWEDQGIMIDVAVHVATLAAIMAYFFRDVGRLIRGGVGLTGLVQAENLEKQWVLFIIAGSVPAVIVGGLFSVYSVTDYLRSPLLVACTLIFYGLLMLYVDRTSRSERKFEEVGLRDAVIVGCAQALALIPGTSRSGITITAARYLGFTRVEAARFSFLLSLPAVAGAGLLVGTRLVDADPSQQQAAIITGIMTFFTALAAMAFLMRWLERAGLELFVYYRVGLGVLLLVLIFTGNIPDTAQ